MENSKILIDKFSFEYYDKLPCDFRLGKMEDFHVNGTKNLGMEYLIKRSDQDYFEIHHVTEETRSKNLIPFFNFKMIFVKVPFTIL